MNLENTKKLMKKLADEKVFDSYAVTVCKDGEKQFFSSENVNCDTYFDIASMGKVLITSPLILKAIGEKKLSLGDTLGRFFSDVPDDRKNITVKQLLTHTSGIVRCFIPRETADAGREALAAHIIGNPLAYKPGEGCIYSCNGMILLGFIAEKIYGMRLDEAYEAVIKPALGLTRSKFNIAPDEENAAVCYTRKEAGEYRSDDENVYNMRGIAGSGAQFFTPSDIERFLDAVIAKSEALYPKEMYTLAEQCYTGGAGEQDFGLGWFFTDERYSQTGKLFPAGSIGHTGWTGTSFFFDRRQNLYTIILTNVARCSFLKNGAADCNSVHTMRRTVHDSIYEDLNR